MNIFLTESQFKQLMEGIGYTKSGDWGIDANIDSRQSDIANKEFDTRLFGSANDILNGDGTKSKNSITLRKQQEAYTNYINVLQNLKAWIEGGRNGKMPDISSLGGVSIKAIEKNLKSENDEEVLQWIDNTIARVSTANQIRANKYNKAISANGNEKIARYNVGVVPGTNIKVICLFDFNDFNVSDVIKNGYMRQNDTTDKILGVSKENRPMNPSFSGKATYRNVPVTYNGITPDIQGNFSLNGIEGDSDHFNRVSYGMNDNGYHSIAKFIDKSVNYAQYALNKEHIQADYILSAPSSSKFNIYYAKRLQDKTGIPFINGFFEKKVINVRFDRKGMEHEGIDLESINGFETNVKSVAMKEISNGIAKPIMEFINNNWGLFNNITFDIYEPKKYKGRRPKIQRPDERRYSVMSGSKIQRKQVYQLIATHAFNELGKMITEVGNLYDDNVSKIILNNMSKEFNSSVFNVDMLSKKVGEVIKSSCLTEFTNAIRKMAWLVATYHDKLLTGFKPNFDGDSFKVTKFSKNVRKYLKGAFIIADEQLNKDKNLFTRYVGKKYIIFDEDMNSGATLAMLGDTLGDYGIPEQNITCLVNGYSNGGF